MLGEWWTYIPWSPAINSTGYARGGKQIARKLSALELVGPLAIVCGAPDLVRGRPLQILVDNSGRFLNSKTIRKSNWNNLTGSVIIWKKGYSTSCELSSTLVRAIYQVSAALECRVDIVKITRCSTPGAEMADALSKADFNRFQQAANKAGIRLQESMGLVPQALLDWLMNPKEDWLLGDMILKEISASTSVMGYNC